MTRNQGWRSDCQKCRASKFTCDEHYRPEPVRHYRDKSGCQYCDGYCHGGCRDGGY